MKEIELQKKKKETKCTNPVILAGARCRPSNAGKIFVWPHQNAKCAPPLSLLAAHLGSFFPKILNDPQNGVSLGFGLFVLFPLFFFDLMLYDILQILCT